MALEFHVVLGAYPISKKNKLRKNLAVYTEIKSVSQMLMEFYFSCTQHQHQHLKSVTSQIVLTHVHIS